MNAAKVNALITERLLKYEVALRERGLLTGDAIALAGYTVAEAPESNQTLQQCAQSHCCSHARERESRRAFERTPIRDDSVSDS